MVLGRHSLRRGSFMAAITFVLGAAAGAVIAPQLSSDRVMADTPPAVAPATPRAKVAPAGYAAEVLRVLDGDTFEARVHVWPGIDITTKVRLRGIDAPELKARCPDERVKAEAARDALGQMLVEGEVTVLRVGLDKYGGRVLADAATR